MREPAAELRLLVSDDEAVALIAAAIAEAAVAELRRRRAEPDLKQKNRPWQAGGKEKESC